MLNSYLLLQLSGAYIIFTSLHATIMTLQCVCYFVRLRISLIFSYCRFLPPKFATAYVINLLLLLLHSPKFPSNQTNITDISQHHHLCRTKLQALQTYLHTLIPNIMHMRNKLNNFVKIILTGSFLSWSHISQA